LKLLAARSFIYDRYLTNFNNGGLSPQDVEQLVQQQREQLARETFGQDTGNKPAADGGGG
jgi:hypothetical protein